MKRLSLWIARCCRSFADWLDPQISVQVSAPATFLEPPNVYEVLAKELVELAEHLSEGTSGEFKRHWVYSKMIKAFPDARKRDLAFAIEKVLQD